MSDETKTAPQRLYLVPLIAGGRGRSVPERVRGQICRVGELPGEGDRLPGWVFDCLGLVPAIYVDEHGTTLHAGFTKVELRIAWAWMRRN